MSIILKYKALMEIESATQASLGILPPASMQ